MPNSSSTMALHFRYRLWIAEMNADINFLRIFDDYLAELESKKNIPAVKSGIESFKKEFLDLRNEIDELRHEMHLCKMSLLADAKEPVNGRQKDSPKGDHAALKTRYTAYRKNFNSIKKEFVRFEGKWL